MTAACHLTWRVQSGNQVKQVELLIPQIQFLDGEGAQAELWELSRIFLDTLIEETRCQKVRAICPDAGAAALLKYGRKDAAFGFASLSDRKPVESQDEIIVMAVPDYQMLERVERIASELSDDPNKYCFSSQFSSNVVSLGLSSCGTRGSLVKMLELGLISFLTVYSMRPLAAADVFRCYSGPGRYLLTKELTSRPDAEELEIISKNVEEKFEQGPSLFSQEAGIFSSLNRKPFQSNVLLSSFFC
ncbi:hypothetical protein CRYUN_Cryun08bG0014200 [Craigia yunnanensis]